LRGLLYYMSSVSDTTSKPSIRTTLQILQETGTYDTTIYHRYIL